MKRFSSSIMIALLIAGTLGFGALAGASAQGNTAAAKACQKGGWATLAPQEAPSAAFQNQDECVSYGAQGGVPVALVVSNPSITVTMAPAGGFCAPSISATGFAPNTTYPYAFSFLDFLDDSEHPIGSGDVTADDVGEISLGGPSFASSPAVAFRVVIGHVSSDFTPYVC